MSKQFLGVIIAIIIALVGIFALTGGKSQSSGGGSKSNPGTLTEHVEGKGTTGVTLVEYGDYQCPYCGEYFPTVQQIVSHYGDKIKFQFRNFPLTEIHQNAFAAARAAEAAGLQNKFWPMNEMLYQNQSQWDSLNDPSNVFNQYAQQAGLNLNQFKTDYASSKVNDLINADEAEGNKLGIQGTPTFFLDGKQLNNTSLIDSSGKPSAAAFEKLIDGEIAKKAGSQAATPAQ